jgi:uncharacterized protein with PIN domain
LQALKGNVNTRQRLLAKKLSKKRKEAVKPPNVDDQRLLAMLDTAWNESEGRCKYCQQPLVRLSNHGIETAHLDRKKPGLFYTDPTQELQVMHAL